MVRYLNHLNNKTFEKGNGGSNIQLTFAAMKLRENILVTLVDMGFFAFEFPPKSQHFGLGHLTHCHATYRFYIDTYS